MGDVIVHELSAVEIGARCFSDQARVIDGLIFELNVRELVAHLCWIRTFHNHFRFGQRGLENELIVQIVWIENVVVTQDLVV